MRKKSSRSHGFVGIELGRPALLIGHESKKRHFWHSPGVQTYNGAFHNLLDGNQWCQRLSELREITKRAIRPKTRDQTIKYSND
jgi:hypothetical protein